VQPAVQHTDNSYDNDTSSNHSTHINTNHTPATPSTPAANHSKDTETEHSKSKHRPTTNSDDLQVSKLPAHTL